MFGLDLAIGMKSISASADIIGIKNILSLLLLSNLILVIGLIIFNFCFIFLILIFTCEFYSG
jgi:hypothetical protein